MLIEYDTTFVGGSLPSDERVSDARPDEMLITIGVGERWRRGSKASVTVYREVTFVLNVVLKFSLISFGEEEDGNMAIPALFTSTDEQSQWEIVQASERLYHLDDRTSCG